MQLESTDDQKFAMSFLLWVCFAVVVIALMAIMIFMVVDSSDSGESDTKKIRRPDEVDICFPHWMKCLILMNGWL